MFGAHRSGYQTILLVLAIYCAMAISITGNPLFFLYDDRQTTLYIAVWMLPIIAWYAVITVRLAASRRARPVKRLFRYTRLNRTWLSRTALLIFAMALWASAFTILKMNIPKWVPFYADPDLMRLDRMLFGADAWRLTHRFIGPAGTVFLDRAYFMWFFGLVGFLGWAIGSRNERFQVQSLLTYVLIWLVLGSGFATTLSSVGPCFVERFYGLDDFAPLMAQLKASDPPLMAVQGMAYLESMYGKTAYANGISAMPSMHVAIAVWFVLVTFAGTRKRWARAFAATYAAIILLASVHLGWHYAVDGLLSIIVTPVIWYLVSMFLSASSRSAVQPAGSSRRAGAASVVANAKNSIITG